MTSTTSPSDTIRLRSRISVGALARPDDQRTPGEIEVVDRPPTGDPQTGRTDDLLIIDDLEVIDPTSAVPAPGLIGPPARATRISVRLFDLLLATAGLIVLAPLMLLVAIAVFVDSPGPVFYGSARLGRGGATFKAWKFRSMRPEADRELTDLLATDDEARREFVRYHKLRNDPRLTRVGAVIRQHSLDELPQLINILLGQMSVVGPRPKADVDAPAYGDALDAVLTVKPGLTGLWQVSGRNHVPMAERVVLDLRYVRERSLLGDVVICGRTFLQLWRPGKHGAY